MPWPYARLDPDVVAAAAYEMHQRASCCYAVSASIIGELAKKVGAPYTSLPLEMMAYGGTGVAGVGSLCGCLNAAAMVTFLVTGSIDKAKQGTSSEITRDLFNWYTQTPLPSYRPAQPKFETLKTISGSNLCHVSVTRWCKAAKCKTTSKEREERCACLSGSVARQTVQLLNAHLVGELNLTHPLEEETQACRGCHDKGSAREDSRAQQDCGACHFTMIPHPRL